MPRVTRHGMKRAYQRAGNSRNKRQSQRMMNKILKYGIEHSEARGSLKALMDKQFLKERNITRCIFYGKSIYLFAGGYTYHDIETEDGIKCEKVKDPNKAILITVIQVSENICQNLKEYVSKEGYEKYQKRKLAYHR